MTSVNLIKFLDKYFGYLICLILSLFSINKKKKKNIDKILLIQLWGIGESILALPSIKTLKERNNKSTIMTVVFEIILFTCNPLEIKEETYL